MTVHLAPSGADPHPATASIDERIETYRASHGDAAEMTCRHINSSVADWFFMREPRSGRGWFLCRACCRHNVELMTADATAQKERWSKEW